MKGFFKGLILSKMGLPSNLEDSTDSDDAIPLLEESLENTSKSEDSVALPATIEARKLAKQLQVNLIDCEGSGPQGRIEPGDVERTYDFSRTETSNLVGQSEISRQDQPADSQFRSCLMVDVKLDALLRYLQNLNEAFISETVLLSDLIIKASSVAMLEVPECNVHFGEGKVHRLSNIDISLFMPLLNKPRPSSLIVRGVNHKSIVEISRLTQLLSDNVESNNLDQESLEQVSLPICDLGMLGVKQFDALLRPPQCCALGLGVAEPRAIIIGGGVGVATMMTLSLSVDFRAIDEANGARYLHVLKRAIENPDMLE